MSPIQALFLAVFLSLPPLVVRAQGATPPPSPVTPQKPDVVQPVPGSAPVDEPPRPVAASPQAPAEGSAGEHAHSAGPADDPNIGGDSPRWKNVALRIVSPREGEVVPEGRVSVALQLSGYETPGSAPPAGRKAPHVHIIVDDKPYLADYDATKPFDVGELKEGPHTLRAFPSRPWHESIKSSPRAFAAVRFWVGKRGEAPDWFDPRKPLLTYSRPKGEYEGDDARRIMVDFYLRNARLSPKGSKVLFWLDGKEQDPFTEWKPRWLSGLEPGEHTFKLSLVDSKGKPIENGGVNTTERKITVK